MPTGACPTCGGNVDGQTGVCPQCATQVNLRSATPTASATVDTSRSDRPAEEAPEISGYRVINQLGEGGMGAVYLAEETTLGRRVAVKVISSRVAPDAQSKARFLREARTLATIEHPNVVRVYAFGEVEGRPYLAMEYVEGETLMERIARMGRLPVDDALRIARDVVDALGAAWDKRVIHRDIKPSNILLDRRNRVRVADFGLAKPSDAPGDGALTLSGLMVGTPHYISPEQAQGKELDFRSDFYSLGIMLFHMLTGERPFQGSTPVAIVAKHIHEAMPLASAQRTDIPAPVEQVVQWMTRKDAEARPGSHEELLAALDSLIARTPTTPMPTFSAFPIPAAPKPDRRRARIVGVCALVLLAAGAAGYFWWSRRDNQPFVFAGPVPKFVVAVAPFYGPDADSAKEGRVMAALVERAVADRLGRENAAVVGIEETKAAVRSHDEARELGTKLGASAVIWGESFALRTETEIRPYVTLVEAAKREQETVTRRPRTGERPFARVNSMESLGGTGAAPVRLEAEAPNQIELRKTSASGIGEMVVLLAGIHALETEKNHDKALALFRQAPRTAPTLRYEVQALLGANRLDEARATLEQAIALDATNAASHALLGDLQLAAQRMTDAIGSYRRAAELGQPYTATRAILHKGRLYLRETYRHEFANDGAEGETLCLLSVDPDTQRVLERWSLPGQIRSFRSEGETLVVGYDAGRDDVPLLGELRLTSGAFDRPLWPPPNFLWRIRAVRGGRILAGNFLGEIDTIRDFGKSGGRYVLRKEPSPELPATLSDLERALREAIDRDPTQPWHPFFLAITLREQQRANEANAVMGELVRRDYPHVAYYHYTWMLATLERLKYTDWADRLYPKALAVRRRVPHASTFSVLIERLINASFVRQAAANRDIARGYTVLTRAREIGGITPEGEDLVATAWARYFEAAGDKARAKQEWDVVRRTHRHPFNYLGSLAKFDYAANVTVATLAAFTILLLMVAALAIGRGRIVADEPRPAGTRWAGLLTRMAGPVRVGVVVLFGSLVITGTMWLFMWGALIEAVIVVALATAVVMLARKTRLTPGAILGSVSSRDRVLLVASYLLFIVSLVVLIDRRANVDVISAIPIGTGDGMGHPRIIDELETLLKERPSDALRYVTAVANHYGGNNDRARSLYGDVSGGYKGLSGNREAVGAGRMPVTPATPEELYAALRGSRLRRWSEVVADLQGPRIAFLGLFVLLLGLFAVPPREVTQARSASRLAKVTMLLLPGLYDVRHGSVARALITLVLLALMVVPVSAYFLGMRYSLGIATANGIPNLATSFPMPSSAPDPVEALTPVFRTAFPFARLYWTVVIASALAGLLLHLLRIPAILREPRHVADEDQPTRVNVASVST